MFHSFPFLFPEKSRKNLLFCAAPRKRKDDESKNNKGIPPYPSNASLPFFVLPVNLKTVTSAPHPPKAPQQPKVPQSKHKASSSQTSPSLHSCASTCPSSSPQRQDQPCCDRVRRRHGQAWLYRRPTRWRSRSCLP